MRASMQGLLLAASAALVGCTDPTTAPPPPQPTGAVVFTTPAGGEDYEIGDTVQIAWRCEDCTNVPEGDIVQVATFDGNEFSLLISGAQLTDSLAWEVGTTLRGALLPGIYLMIVQDAAEYYFAQSRFFEVLPAPAPVP